MRRWIPQFRIRTLLIGITIIAILTPVFVTQLRRWREADGEGLIIWGDASNPDARVIRTFLQQSGQHLPSASSDVYQLKVMDYVDPPFRVPVLGKFQRRHRHYECGLPPKQNPNALPPVTMKRSELRWVTW